MDGRRTTTGGRRHEGRRLCRLGLVVLAAASCEGEIPPLPFSEDPPLPDAPGPDWSASDVGDVKIVPSSVWALAGSAFVLKARVFSAATGDVLAPSATAAPVWSAAPSSAVAVEGLDGGVAKGHEAVVRVLAGASTPGKVEVTVDGQSADAVIYVVPAPATDVATDDVVVDSRPAGGLGVPPVALAEGAHGGGSCPEYLAVAYAGVALVGKALVGNMVSGCDGEASLFAQAQGIELAAHVWQDAAGEEVRLPTAFGTGTALPTQVGPIPVVVRLAVTPVDGFATVAEAVHSALRHAVAVFDSNRVGLTFVLAEDKLHDIRAKKGYNWEPDLLKVGDLVTCPDLAAEGLAHGDSLVVVVVAGLKLNGAAGYKGYRCAPDTTQGQVLLVAFPHLALTLAHEFGHALLGRRHPSTAEGFPSHNLMVRETKSTTAAPDAHISVGQAFRATREETSWWNARVLHPGTRNCGVKPCPKPSLDPSD